MSQDDRNNKLDENLMNHNYDGIQELDNPMPSWWLATFFITIIFSGIYYLHFEVSKISTSDSELQAGMQEIELLRKRDQRHEADEPKEELEAYVNNKEYTSKGEAIYSQYCLSCHGPGGGGLIGPNLTDKYWIHGDGSIKAILNIVHEGVADKGMPPWGSLLNTEKLEQVSVFVKSLAGSKPAGAKPAQGKLIE